MVEEGIKLGKILELATTKTIYVNRLNLNEIKNEIFLDYTGAFEKIGSLLIGGVEQKTNKRFR